MTDVIETSLQPIDPGDSTADSEPGIPGPAQLLARAQWSTRARQRLMAALVMGAVMVLIGALLFLEPTRPQDFEGLLLMYLGLILMPIGVGLIFLAVRTLLAAPDRLYQPQSPVVPRNLFVVLWLAGVIVPLFLHVEVLSELKTFSLVGLLIAVAFVLSGGRWAYRWFANKLRDEWPTGRVNAPLALPLRWPASWSIGWAVMLGVLATVLAGGLEILIVWMAANLLGPTLASSFQTSDILGELLSQPLVVIGLVVAVAVIAPAIEEAFKALGLRVLRGSIQRPIDGLMLGMAIGISFGMLESALYLGTLSGWLIGGWLRLSTLVLHGIATSLVGVAYARSLHSNRRRDLWAGYGRAVLLHGTWNASAIGIGLGFSATAWLWLGIVCLVVLILLIARIIPRAVMAGADTVIQEGYQQAGANLPAEWSPSDDGIGWRLMGSRPQRGVRNVSATVLKETLPPPGDQSPGDDATPGEVLANQLAEDKSSGYTTTADKSA